MYAREKFGIFSKFSLVFVSKGSSDEKGVGKKFLFELLNKTYILGFWKSRLTSQFSILKYPIYTLICNLVF